MKSTAAQKQSYSTTEVAQRFGVNISKVGDWIRSGELQAINVAKSAHGNRPRYRISREAIESFELSRSVVPPPPPTPRRKRPPAPTKDYF